VQATWIKIHQKPPRDCDIEWFIRVIYGVSINQTLTGSGRISRH